MVTLYKRATPSQRQVLKIIEGAVKNVADAHGHEYDPYLARSIAKRAAGTLTARWPDVLAIASSHASSDSADGGTPAHAGRPRGSQLGKGPERGPPHVARRSPLHKLWKRFALEVGKAKRAGLSGLRF